MFDQATWWVDVNQRPHRISEMSAEYIGNVIGHLEEHRDYLYVGTLRRGLLQMYGDALLGRVATEVVAVWMGATPG